MNLQIERKSSLKDLAESVNEANIVMMVRQCLERLNKLEEKFSKEGMRGKNRKKTTDQYILDILENKKTWSVYSIYEELTLLYPTEDFRLSSFYSIASKLCLANKIERMAQGCYRLVD